MFIMSYIPLIIIPQIMCNMCVYGVRARREAERARLEYAKNRAAIPITSFVAFRSFRQNDSISSSGTVRPCQSSSSSRRSGGQ